MAPNRYYSTPYTIIGDNWMNPGTAYCMPVLIPHRTTISTIGMYALEATGSGRNALFAIYTADKGRVQNMVWQSPALWSASDVGIYKTDVNVMVDAGTYWLIVIANSNLKVKFHSAVGKDQRMGWYGATDPTLSDANLQRLASLNPGVFSLGMFPQVAGQVPNYTVADSEPHVFFTVTNLS
jgi:hypothetical protein